MYRGDQRQQIRQPTNPAVALERIRHGMQIPAVQGAVDPTQMHPSGLSNRSLPRGPGAIIPAPSITSATAFARRGAGRSGVGITRFLTTSVNANSATATAADNHYVPSVSVSETSNQSTLQSPYQVQDPSTPACMMSEHRPFLTMSHSRNLVGGQVTCLLGSIGGNRLDLHVLLQCQVVDHSQRQWCW